MVETAPNGVWFSPPASLTSNLTGTTFAWKSWADKRVFHQWVSAIVRLFQAAFCSAQAESASLAALGVEYRSRRLAPSTGCRLIVLQA